MILVKFIADRVKVKTGKADNSADVVLEVGEYELEHITELVSIVDKELEVTVRVKN